MFIRTACRNFDTEQFFAKWFGDMQAEQDTRRGKVISYWCKEGGFWRYEITTPVEAEIVIDGKARLFPAGSYLFCSPINE